MKETHFIVSKIYPKDRWQSDISLLLRAIFKDEILENTEKQGAHRGEVNFSGRC